MEQGISKCDECGRMTSLIHYVGELGNLLSPKKLCGECYEHYRQKDAVVQIPSPLYTPPIFDEVKKPQHYADSKVEVIDALEAWGLTKFSHLANAVKYIARHHKKSEDPTKQIQDLEKARYYLDREINNRKGDLNGKTTNC